MRLRKISKLLQREISQILLKEIEFEKAMVTVTDVDVFPNLQRAKVLVTVMPCGKLASGVEEEFDTKENEVMMVLKRNTINIQRILNRKLNMKPIPRIEFEIDKGMKNLYQIDEIIEKKL